MYQTYNPRLRLPSKGVCSSVKPWGRARQLPVPWSTPCYYGRDWMTLGIREFAEADLKLQRSEDYEQIIDQVGINPFRFRFHGRYGRRSQVWPIQDRR